jgi:hypothetical protein
MLIPFDNNNNNNNNNARCVRYIPLNGWAICVKSRWTWTQLFVKLKFLSFSGPFHPLSHFPMQCMSGRKQHGREEIIRIRVYLSSASVQKKCVTPSLFGWFDEFFLMWMDGWKVRSYACATICTLMSKFVHTSGSTREDEVRRGHVRGS